MRMRPDAMRPPKAPERAWESQRGEGVGTYQTEVDVRDATADLLAAIVHE